MMIDKLNLIASMFLMLVLALRQAIDGNWFRAICYVGAAMGLATVFHTLCRLQWLADWEFKMSRVGAPWVSGKHGAP